MAEGSADGFSGKDILSSCHFLMSFVEIPGEMTFEKMGLESFAAFHPPAYIHSLMVAKIPRCLTGHLDIK